VEKEEIACDKITDTFKQENQKILKALRAAITMTYEILKFTALKEVSLSMLQLFGTFRWDAFLGTTKVVFRPGCFTGTTSG
jgi:hypothetical protein